MRDENKFLAGLIEHDVDLYLVNGIRLHGRLIAAFKTALLLRDDEGIRQMMIYKQAISTIVGA